MRFSLSAALVALLAMTGAASAVTVTMDAGGAFGNVGTSTNKLIGTRNFAGPLLDPRVTKVEISQATGDLFTLQGNDLVVSLKFFLSNSTTVTIDNATVNWRTTNGNTVTGFGILPPAGTTKPVGNFTVLGAAGRNAGSNIFLASPRNAYTPIADNTDINGNAATVKTLLDDLNSLVTPPAGTPAMRVQKVAEYDDVNNVIDYTITVTNATTDQSLANVTLIDTLTLDGTDINFTDFAFSSIDDQGTTGDTAPDGSVLGVGDSVTYTATLDLDTAPYDSVEVFENLATASAQPFDDVDLNGIVDGEEAAGTSFSTESTASGNSIAGDGAGSPTVLSFTDAEMTVTKTADTSALHKPVQPDDVIRYTITVANTGSVDLLNLELTDALTADEAYDSGNTDSDITSLAVGETQTYTATYVVTEDDIAAGKVDNLAVATAETEAGDALNVESSDTGNTTGDGSPTTVDFGLIDQIKDDLTDILESDLRQTIQMQSARFARMSKSALETLKEGQSDECGTIQPLDANGNATTEGGSLAANVAVNGETVDCVTGERRIVTADLTSSTVDGMGQQIAGAFSIQRERFASADAVRGRFVGGYVTSNDVTGRADGSILGLGVNAGIYGASRLSSQVYLDHYLAVAVGRHSFDLNFGALDPINATGDYSYLAGFGGLALSTSMTKGAMEIAPRLALDVAYAAAGDVNVIARQFDRVERGTLSLSNYEGARMTAEVLFANIDSAAETSGVSLEATPRLFCDVSLNDGFEDDCGYGASLSLDADAGAGLSYSALFDFEDSADRRALTFSLERSREIAGGSGAVISTMGTSDEGDLRIGQMLKLRF